MMETRKIIYSDQETVLEATVSLQEGEHKRPIILIFHAWEGKNSFIEEKAKYLAGLGYIGCALDLYGKGILGKTREECGKLMQPLVSDRQALLKRILAYEGLLKNIPEADTDQIGAIGFCFGGLCVLDLARSNAKGVKGVASFHGVLHAPKESSETISSKVLVLHGNNDRMISSEELLGFKDEMEQKKAEWQLHIFGNTVHSFTNPGANDPAFGTVYNKSADKRSFRLMEDFFKETFQG
jgi:dienelactone hydrolase